MPQEVAGGGGGGGGGGGVVYEGAGGCLKRSYLMMKTSTATILFLRVHISSIRQIGVYYKAMICQSEGAGNVHTEERIFAVDVFIVNYAISPSKLLLLLRPRPQQPLATCLCPVNGTGYSIHVPVVAQLWPVEVSIV